MAYEELARFMSRAYQDEDLRAELTALAARHGFDLDLDPDRLSDEELDAVTGGADLKIHMSSLAGSGFPDGLTSSINSAPPSVPIPYPNGTSGDSGVSVEGDGDSSGTGDTQKDVTTSGG